MIFDRRGRSSANSNILVLPRRAFLTSFPAAVCKVVVEDGCYKILTMSSAAYFAKSIVET